MIQAMTQHTTKPLFKKVLIANRGEIACRIARTARRLGIGTVAVYSDADARALHVSQADEAVHIGPSPATESYLRIDTIIAAARQTGADCIHPGYGFLAENAGFAQACAEAGIKFIGPTPDAMRKMGGKAEAKAIAQAAGVPVVPGYNGDSQDGKTLLKQAKSIGFPVMIKAVAGGGGRGMRLVEKSEEFQGLLDSAVREATASFGDGRVLIEKLVVKPRHIEVQVFGDSHGTVVHLFERDCSLQRRNQKVIEEAPAPGMSAALRAKMTAAAVRCAQAVRYEGAGTVEFLVEGGKLGPDAPWYFIEMNTRLQVEHPVTEEVTGLDLVEWQFRVAAGETLPLRQDEIQLGGHAIEVRLCAEDPANGFMPSLGKIAAFTMPDADGVRLETGVEAGSQVSPYYDSMIAKIIARGSDRAEALARLVPTLKGTVVAGPRTNGPFLLQLLADPNVVAGTMDTGLIGRELTRLTEQAEDATAICLGVLNHIQLTEALISRQHNRNANDYGSPWDYCDGFQLGPARSLVLPVMVDGRERAVMASWPAEHNNPQIALQTGTQMVHPSLSRAADIYVKRGRERTLVVHNLVQTEIAWPAYSADQADDGDGSGTIKAPISGKVAKVFVTKGATVAKGDRIAVVEAMKMEHVLSAPMAGIVVELKAQEGEQVAGGAVLARIEAATT